jgi:hypothetical protein
VAVKRACDEQAAVCNNNTNKVMHVQQHVSSAAAIQLHELHMYSVMVNANLNSVNNYHGCIEGTCPMCIIQLERSNFDGRHALHTETYHDTYYKYTSLISIVWYLPEAAAV